jgi:hypothetical protein
MHQPNNDDCGFGGSAPCKRGTALFSWPALIGALLSVTLGPAAAETQVRGQPDDMSLQAENASIGEILAALSAEFNIGYKLAAIPGRSVTGNYSGTLQQVLVRVLDSYNYFIKNLDDRMEIVVLGAVSPASASNSNGHPPPVAVLANPVSVVPSSVAHAAPSSAIAANQGTTVPAVLPLRPNVPR